eukprot:TRINITY_DN708_c0_g1_i2.p1 TRINITY_DN708_c0_g1~~TRINITY_DN708_c0_g1_i2.p1  ORF type:complete len:250 (+),score=48.13 TRINITY_DN708_c0_g1_i2:38-787(+)
MSTLAYGLFLVLLFNVAYSADPVVPCTAITATDGTKYDLTALANHGEIKANDEKSEWTYTVTICKNQLPCVQSNDPTVCANPGAGYCQKGITANFIYCIGVVDATSIVGKAAGAGVELTYKSPRGGRVGKVTVNCDQGGDFISKTVAISPQTVNGYTFTFSSCGACPGGGGSGCHDTTGELSGGSIFLIIVFSLLFVYVVSVSIFNYVKNDARTPMEILPHVSFWKSVPGLVQDGVSFVISKIRSAVGK